MHPREFCICSREFCFHHRELILQKLRFTLILLCTPILCDYMAAALGLLSGR